MLCKSFAEIDPPAPMLCHQRQRKALRGVAAGSTFEGPSFAVIDSRIMYWCTLSLLLPMDQSALPSSRPKVGMRGLRCVKQMIDYGLVHLGVDLCSLAQALRATRPSSFASGFSLVVDF